MKPAGKFSHRSQVCELLNEIIEILQENIPGEFKVYLYGSWARGDAQPGSDLDIAVEAAPSIPAEVWTSLKRKVDGLRTLRKIDLVQLDQADEKFSRMVKEEGEIVYGD